MVNIPHAHEKNVYFAVGGCSVLLKKNGLLKYSSKSSSLIVFQICYSYTTFYLFILSVTRRGWQDPQLWLDMCFSLFSFCLFQVVWSSTVRQLHFIGELGFYHYGMFIISDNHFVWKPTLLSGLHYLYYLCYALSPHSLSFYCFTFKLCVFKCYFRYL